MCAHPARVPILLHRRGRDRRNLWCVPSVERPPPTSFHAYATPSIRFHVQEYECSLISHGPGLLAAAWLSNDRTVQIVAVFLLFLPVSLIGMLMYISRGEPPRSDVSGGGAYDEESAPGALPCAEPAGLTALRSDGGDGDFAPRGSSVCEEG